MNVYKKKFHQIYVAIHPPLGSSGLLAKLVKYIIRWKLFMDEYINTPVTVDGILEKNNEILLIIRQSNTFDNYLALPGGFVEYGEKVEEALVRELKEELNLKIIPIDLLGVYSGLERDPRGPVTSIVFICKFEGEPVPGTDAAGFQWLNLSQINGAELAFDHNRIINHYKKWKVEGGTYWTSK